jgi:hypothetical protein
MDGTVTHVKMDGTTIWSKPVHIFKNQSLLFSIPKYSVY